ncbi:MAG: helix-turn-helix transcriptional regulator [Hydrococcus sp. RM1_1_31]|nr:helix-turn-helix transcriptional regulator [Hydrococcus sp. RM1_1_31]
MIRWRLRVLMAERNINNKTLAEMTGLNRVTISRLKNTDNLKQISGEVLNQLCNALDCTPNDLIEFTPDRDFPNQQKDQTDIDRSQQKRIGKENKKTKTSTHQNISLVPDLEIPESA